MGGVQREPTSFWFAAFVILTCLLAEYVNMLNTAKSKGGPRKQTGWHSLVPAPTLSRSHNLN